MPIILNNYLKITVGNLPVKIVSVIYKLPSIVIISIQTGILNVKDNYYPNIFIENEIKTI